MYKKRNRRSLVCAECAQQGPWNVDVSVGNKTAVKGGLGLGAGRGNLPGQAFISYRTGEMEHFPLGPSCFLQYTTAI